MILLPLSLLFLFCGFAAAFLWRLLHVCTVDVVAVPMILEGEAAAQWFDREHFHGECLLSMEPVVEPRAPVLFGQRMPRGLQ